MDNLLCQNLSIYIHQPLPRIACFCLHILQNSYVTLKLVFRFIKTSPFSEYKIIKSRIYKESSLIMFQSFLFKSTVELVLRGHLWDQEKMTV